MKKRFTLMMMVLCFLMSIPLEMMAKTVTIHFVDEEGWGDHAAYVYDKSKKVDPVWVTDKWPGQVAAASDIEEVNYKGKKVKVVTRKIDLKECAAGNAYVLFNNNKYNNIEKKYPSSVGWEVKDGQYYYKDGTTSTTPPSEGSGSGSGTTYPTISVKSQYKQEGWGPNNNFNFTTINGTIYTCELKDVPANETVYFRIVKNDKEWGPNSGSNSNLKLTSEYQTIYQVDNSSVSLQIGPSTVQSTYTITYDSENNQIKCTSTSGSGTGGSTPVDWNTVSENRLKNHVYSQGFYLAGNFFSFSGNEVTYDDAVFKFQQQKNDTTIESGKEYEVYKVEIPASLKAHAQVMYVNEFREIKNIFGPGVCSITNTYPSTDTSIGWLEAKVNDCVPITKENSNYWDFVNRNQTADNYSDGMYNLYIAVDPATHTVKKWKIEHDSDKRVAYFISDAVDATAMPIYDAFDKSQHTKVFSNKFYGSVNFSADHNYYVISNILQKSKYISWTTDKYETKLNNKDYLPTTNKLFLQGNGGYEYSTNDQHNQVSPNEMPLPGGDLGNIIVEYNPSSGWDTPANTAEHLGIRGQILQRDGHKKITSVSMVGDAIPGTLNEDGSWDFTSHAANMTYDDVEQCYTTTIVTTVGDGEKHFRFVGNHDPKINWYEDTDGTEADKKAKTPHTSKTAPGHSADASDPNKVDYTQAGDFSDDKYHILWNRDAGRWTVRLYFYTYNVGGEPVTDYYYTINKNSDLVLRDFEDVKYKTEGKREILLRGGYKFFRTWSDHKAWKVSKDVDIFIVNGMKEGDNSVEFSLKNISDETQNVIPADLGVILATKEDATTIAGGGKFYERPSLTSYNTLVIPMEEYTGTETIADYNSQNLLKAMVEADVVPTYNETTDQYNYLFGFFRAQKGLNDYTHYTARQFVLGFWLSQGAGLFYSNSAYLPVKSATAAKMKLGTKYGQFEPNPATGKSMYIPALLFDFANVGGTTGINEVVNQSTKLNDGKYYTLSGQQVEKPTAGGIYIHNGRKFVVK